jgi:hypothetical protein
MDIIPDLPWQILHYWYQHMCVHVKWGVQIGDKINVNRGTKQGGLTSPFIFNVFYEDLINDLQSCNHGVTIKGLHINTICYADDILLCSLSVSGLQKMINISTNYIESHGLRFNPHKTTCHTMGPNSFISQPQWFIDGTLLKIEDTITYPVLR